MGGLEKGGKWRQTIARSDLTPSVVMYIFNVSVSVFWGYPKSRISVV